MNISKKLLTTTMLGIALIGGSSMINVNASKTAVKSSWNANNQEYNKVLNGKHALFANPSFKHNNYKIYSRGQLAKNHTNDITYKIIQGISTNKGTKYYRLVSSTNPNIRGWVYSKGISNVNTSQNNINKVSNTSSSDMQHYNSALSYMKTSIEYANKGEASEDRDQILIKYKNISITDLKNVTNNVNQIKNIQTQNKLKQIILNDTHKYFYKVGGPNIKGDYPYAFKYKGQKYGRWCTPLKQIPNTWNEIDKYLYPFNTKIDSAPLG